MTYDWTNHPSFNALRLLLNGDDYLTRTGGYRVFWHKENDVTAEIEIACVGNISDHKLLELYDRLAIYVRPHCTLRISRNYTPKPLSLYPKPDWRELFKLNATPDDLSFILPKLEAIDATAAEVCTLIQDPEHLTGLLEVFIDLLQEANIFLSEFRTLDVGGRLANRRFHAVRFALGWCYGADNIDGHNHITPALFGSYNGLGSGKRFLLEVLDKARNVQTDDGTRTCKRCGRTGVVESGFCVCAHGRSRYAMANNHHAAARRRDRALEKRL